MMIWLLGPEIPSLKDVIVFLIFMFLDDQKTLWKIDNLTNKKLNNAYTLGSKFIYKTKNKIKEYDYDICYSNDL